MAEKTKPKAEKAKTEIKPTSDSAKAKPAKETKIKASYSNIITTPLSTEKAMRLMGEENKLLFIVDRKATRTDVKREVEALFNVKVEKVNICIDPKSKKRAWVKFSPETPAVDVAATLGLI